MTNEAWRLRSIDEVLNDLLATEFALPVIAEGFPFLPPGKRGLSPGELVTIAGAASSGKTALAIGLADHIASGREARPVGVFALADSIQDLALRLLSKHSGVSASALRKGTIAQWHRAKVLQSLHKLKSAPLELFHRPDFNICSILNRARLSKQKGRLDLLLIDYLELLEDPESSYDNPEDVFSGIVRKLKFAAKELQVPVVVVAGMDYNSERRPSLEDLGTRDVLADHSDLVVMIHRPKPWTIQDPLEPAEVLFVKNRTGPTCAIMTEWIPELATFADLAAA